jgi:hypothetical protein
MSDHEHDIATYLTLDGHVFLAPQYNVAYDRDLNDGGALAGYEAMAMIRKGQVRNIGGNDIRAQAEFIAALFEVAA